MLDRLVTSAGALADATDRGVRSIAPGRAAATRPVSLVVAAVLLLVAVLLVLGATETATDPQPQAIPAGRIDDEIVRRRTHATVDGGLSSYYVEYFQDLDFDQTWDEDETVFAWNYFLVDPVSLHGLTIVSERPPAEVYTLATQGRVVEDPAYVQDALDHFFVMTASDDLTIDRTRYLDATGARSEGSATSHDLALDLPATGSTIAVSGARSPDYAPWCSTDPGGSDGAEDDGTCEDDEFDRFDVVVFDPVSKRGVLVVTDIDPEFAPTSLTGIVRHDPDTVTSALTVPGVAPDDLGFSVSQDLILDEGAQPSSSWILLVLAVVLTGLALAIGIGVAGGYMRFHADPGVSGPGRALTGPSADALADGERLPLRVTGRLRGRDGDVPVREAAADLVAFPLTDDPSGPATLIIERRGRPEGIAVGPDEVRSAPIAGSVASLRSERPAVQLTTTHGPLILTFDDTATRDRAIAHLDPPRMEETSWTPGN